MPRYMIERNFPDGLEVPMTAEGALACRRIVDLNAGEGVTWLHSYVSPDRSRSYCVYDGPSPEALRAAAKLTGLPLGSITEVSVLDPYFYH